MATSSAPTSIGHAKDPAEARADRLATHMLGGAANVHSTPAPKSGSSQLHRAARSGSKEAGGPLPRGMASTLARQRGGGDPLPTSFRSKAEANTGHDLSGIRVHHDRCAASMSERIGARAFSAGSDLYFGRDQYRPDRPEGERLLAHEVAHGVDGQAVVRRWQGNAEDEYPAMVSLVFTLSGLRMVPRTQGDFRSDVDASRQGVDMLTNAVAGERATPALAAGLSSHLQTRHAYEANFEVADGEGNAKPLETIYIDLPVSVAALRWLWQRLRADRQEAAHETLGIPRDRLELLTLGMEIDVMWGLLQRPAIRESIGVEFPSWYGIQYFRHEMAHRATLLREYRRMRASSRDGNNYILDELAWHAYDSCSAVEAMRNFQPLFGNGLFREFWGMGALPEGVAAADAGGPAADATPDPTWASSFISFAHSQPGPLERVLLQERDDPDPRQDLWERFERFVHRAHTSGDSLRDEVLSDGYSDRNAPPLPATLSAFPPLAPPHFDVVTDTDMAFTMDVSFSDVYEAVANSFGGYAYIFETIRVENDSLDAVESTARSQPGSGEIAGWHQVWGARMRRQGRYLAADYRTAGEAVLPGYDADEDSTLESIARLQLTLGPVGQSVSTFVALNAAVRTIGEVISTIFTMLTTPRHEKRLVFPTDGLYVVRAFCTPELDEDSEFRRAPSVAWLPVWARSPANRALLRAQADVSQALSQELALVNVLARLSEKEECDDEYAQLEQQREALAVTLYGTADEVLEQQERSLNARKGQLETPAEGSPEAAMSAAERQAAIEQIERSLESLAERRRIRGERNTGGRLDRGERITASFASDTGQVIRPLLEATQESASNGRFRYYLSDVTNENASYSRGSGRTRTEAILDALENRFEQHSAYGRGQLVAFIPERRGGRSGQFHNIRIDADISALAMEGIENITTAISVAAIVAAPFTGGASLAILMPIGIIGSVPAAYRIADRAASDTLRMDLQTAMDLVDIVGSFVSVGEGLSQSLRLFRTARFLGVIGFGVDGLGVVAVNWQTIDAMRNLDPNLSPGERRLEIMRIMGGALQANGMFVGGQLLSHAQGGTDMESSQPHPHADADPHADVDVDGTHPRADADGDSAMSHVDDTAGPRAPRAQPDPEFSGRLPGDLRGRVQVEIDESLGQHGRNTVHVAYETDAWGLVTEISIRRAPNASMADVELHLSTVRRMQQFQGVSGWIRNILGHLGAAVGLGRHIEVGSMAWEARLELRKLPEVIQARMAELEAAVNHGRPADADAIAADIAFLEAQARAHQRTLDEMIDARGRGHVAAASGDPGDTRASLRRRRGTDAADLTSIPDGWTGNMEARWRNYAAAPEGYYWRLREGDGEVSLFLQRTRSEQPALAYDHVNGDFHEFDSRPPSQRGEGAAPSAMPSRTSAQAILEGYPPPPPGHHYVTVSEGVYRLRVDPDISAHPDIVPQILIRGEDGNFRFEPRPEGSQPQIEYRPRETMQHDAPARMDASQTTASVDPREDWSSLIAARDQAIARRQAMAEGAPRRGTPEFEAWRETPEYRDYTRAANQVAERSRVLGEVAAESYVRANYPGAERIWPPGSTRMSDASSHVGDFDQVWRFMDADGETHFIVIESKGGTAGPGSRMVNGVRVEQGTRRYYDAIVDRMARPGAPDDMRAVGQQLREHGDAGVNVAYVMVQQPLTTEGGATVAGASRATEFDIDRVESLPTAP